MAVIKEQRKAFQLAYQGIGTKSGGCYTYNNIKNEASDENVDLMARAVGDLQSKIVEGVYLLHTYEIAAS